MADRDKVDPADEPDVPATPADPDDATREPAADERPSDEESTEERELVTAGPRSRRASADDAESGSESAGGRVKKDKATPKQKRGVEEQPRTGPVTFVKQSVGELRKVVYPTGPQLANYFVVVLIFVLFIIAYVSLLDLGIGAAIFRIFA